MFECNKYIIESMILFMTCIIANIKIKIQHSKLYRSTKTTTSKTKKIKSPLVSAIVGVEARHPVCICFSPYNQKKCLLLSTFLDGFHILSVRWLSCLNVRHSVSLYRVQLPIGTDVCVRLFDFSILLLVY